MSLSTISSSPEGYPTSFTVPSVLSGRRCIDRVDAGLNGVSGAQDVVEMISSRKRVAILSLTRNNLADSGCVTLFRFLCSEEGKRNEIAEICLASNNIGDRGLLAVAEYLKNNDKLKTLYLQNNRFQGTQSTIATFTTALNSSRLAHLVLSTNHKLGDGFASRFFPALNTPYLKEIYLSATGLTRLSVSHIIEYINSPRCKLNLLRCNRNKLTYKGVSEIIAAIERANWSLTEMEMFDNQLKDEDAQGLPGWQYLQAKLKRALWRNADLRDVIKKEALTLLRVSRAILTSASRINSTSMARPHPFSILPIEIKLHILSFVAPSLSSAQRIRIYNYASTPIASPQLNDPFPRLPSIDRPVYYSTIPVEFSRIDSCSHSGCNSSSTNGRAYLLCRWKEERALWLTNVGCDVYEPD